MVGQARRSVQGCDLNARTVARRVKLAKLSQPKRIKSYHVQSRVHHVERYATLTAYLSRDPATSHDRVSIDEKAPVKGALKLKQ